eukprot:m.460055 g.460055  ORF g.460055 m.460055 type:complete len:725 (-) comp21588_c0_seq1:236-2410(-)
MVSLLIASVFILAHSASGITTVGESVKSCSDLMEGGNPHGFAYRQGSTSVCSTSRVVDPADPDDGAQCHKSSLTFDESVELCEEIGARLCTFDELQNNLALSPQSGQCGLDVVDSYCWNHEVAGTGPTCITGEHHVSRCKHAGGSQPMCVAETFLGSLKCCADGIVEQGSDRRSVIKAKCAKHTCGKQCSQEPGCGWSSTGNKCKPCGKPGGCTSRAEMTMGPGCVEPETDIFDASARKERCIQHTCGFTCAKDRLCGWSSTKGKCVAGGKTSKRELTEGVCETSVCNDFKCGATCSEQFGCGWSTARMQCMGGAKTNKKEMTMGVCTAADFTGAKSDVDFCGAIKCGADCAAMDGCGWSKTQQRCKAGLSTSRAELTMGDCTEGAHCSTYLCAKDCAKHSGCGWSSGKMVCKIGGKVSKGEMDMCGTRAPTPAPPPPAPTRLKTPKPVVEDQCTDFADWTDKIGSGCQAYADNFWCNKDGSVGAGLEDSGDTLADYAAADGTDASTACCACGGGVLPTDPPTQSPTTAAPTSPAPTTPAPTAACFDKYSDYHWKDSGGDDCEAYEINLWCNADGTYGSGWDLAMTYAQWTDAATGLDASEACCACGGGSPTRQSKPTAAPTRPPTKAPTRAPTRPPTRAPTEKSVSFSLLGGGKTVCSVTENALADRKLYGKDHTDAVCRKRCEDDSSCVAYTYFSVGGYCRVLRSCAVKIDQYASSISYLKD